ESKLDWSSEVSSFDHMNQTLSSINERITKEVIVEADDNIDELEGGLKMSAGTLRQILLITDGRSNSGVSPIEAAKKAFSQGIVVNVIGVLHPNQSELDPEFQEIEQIARSGGGVSQVVYKENLSQTVQAVTKQAMSQTLQGFVHQELKHIFGTERELVDIEPDKRGEVMEVVEDLGEACELEVFVLVDTSASMRDKLLTVKEALIDLSMNLDARSGRNHFAI